MDARTLQDRITKGMGVAARKCGEAVTIFRPSGPVVPLSPNNKIIELSAQFLPGASDTITKYGQPLWRGVYDGSYSRAGDYLVGQDRTFFVAQQQAGLPIQCVMTNRIVSVVRPLPAASGGYSGFFSIPGEAILTDWPASLLADGGRVTVGKAGETRFGSWTLLLPVGAAVAQPADVVNDDLGGVYNVSSVEQGALGWRIVVHQLGA